MALRYQLVLLLVVRYSIALEGDCSSQHVLENDGSTFCSGFINYPFRRSRQTLGEMNEHAMRLLGGIGLNSTRAWYLLSNSCLTSMKRLACAQTYTPCDGPALPCQALCDSVDDACRSQLWFLQDIGFNVLDCSNGTTCTNVGTPLVGETQEKYLGTVCSAYVSDVSITKLHANYAPFQPPGFAQQILESSAASLISEIPGWADKRCQDAAHAFICASFFPVPTRARLVTSNASLPRMSSLKNCESYLFACSDMFARAHGYLDPRLLDAQNCSSRSLEMPGAQIGVSMSSSGRILDLKLAFDVYSTEGEKYENGRIITESFRLRPKHESNVVCVFGCGKKPFSRDYVLEIKNSGCAVNCPIPYRTRFSFRMENSFNLFSGTSSICVSLYNCLTYTWVVERRKTQPLLAMCFTSILLRRLFFQIPFLGDLALKGMGDGDQSSFICHDKVSRTVASDGGICVAQSYGLLSSAVAEYITAMFIAVDIYVRVAHVPENPNRFIFFYYVPCICISTILFGVLPMAATNAAGAASKYGRMEPLFCFARLDRKGALVYATLNAVFAIAPFLTVWFMLNGIYHLVKAVQSAKHMTTVNSLHDKATRTKSSHRSSHQKRTQQKMFQFIRIPLAFLTIRVGEMLWNWGIFNVMVSKEEAGNGEGLDSWYDCLLEHWQLSSHLQQKTCGTVPARYRWRGGQGLLEGMLVMSVLRDVIYLFLFSLSRESVRAWLKQHPNLRPFFGNLEKKRDLLDRIGSGMTSITRLAASLYKSRAPSQILPTEYENAQETTAE